VRDAPRQTALLTNGGRQGSIEECDLPDGQALLELEERKRGVRVLRP